MMHDASYLHIYLQPFAAHLQRPDVTDIYVNRPGEIWVETLGGAAERHDAPGLDESSLMRLARQVASLSHQGISREHPLLSSSLPDGTRIQAIAPPATRHSVVLALRKHVSAELSLDDYEAQGAFSQTSNGGEVSGLDAELGRMYEARLWAAFLRLAVRARKTIIVSGGTSTGKTTFVNSLMAEIPMSERLLLIEDTPELLLRHANAVSLLAVRGELGEARVTTDDLLVASLRMRPDRIILGELRGGEAQTFLRAINTGHPGSLTTIHADTPLRAIEQLAFLTLQSGNGMRHEDIISYIGRVVDVVVQLERRDGRRQVDQILWCGRRGHPVEG